jgi:ketosteroid isomerase-like protein
MRRALLSPVLLAALLVAAAPTALAQTALDPLSRPSSASSQLTDPVQTPGTAFLFDLERKFAAATATGGGKAFASWFADDAVILSNAKAPVRGREAIAASAAWSPSDYQLTWTPQGGAMSPSGDMGYTWGHYDGRSKDASGQSVTLSGRYMTIWRRQPDGSWKVVLDSSNNEPPDANDCCKLPEAH